MHPFELRVAHLGFPDSCTLYRCHQEAVWNAQSVGRLKELGFNAVQLNLAWGARPDDEPLNIEDVVELDPATAAELTQPVPLRCCPGPEAFVRRRAMIADRLALCRAHGLRTIFHFGAPYNAHGRYGDGPPNCICDDQVARRYEALLDVFARDFPGVDDILVYTYDQDAWLCSEFGPCPRCLGRPLHKRLVPFLSRLASRWQRTNPHGRLWWEPWELSAGQVYACVEALDSGTTGLTLHANIAECQATVVADRWLENTAALARHRGIPVVVEWFLGALSEELEPLANVAHPLLTWRGLAKIARVAGVTGIKEYYGLLPMREDPNLRATALFLARSDLHEDQAMRLLAQPYGALAGAAEKAWRLASSAMEMYPWDTTWFGREIGRSRTDFSLSAAILRPMLCPTPSWQSTRGTVFMRTEDTPAHPWMLEDVHLRCTQAARLWREAEEALAEAASSNADLGPTLADLGKLRRRAQAYSLHLRATCLAIAMRKTQSPPAELLDELGGLLAAAEENDAEERSSTGTEESWQEIIAARVDLKADPVEFLKRWLTESPDHCSRGPFSMTSS